MARINNLSNFLIDVSSAIKQKTGDDTPISAADFDTEILSIPSQGIYQEKTINIVQNGNVTLLPDQNYDAISKVMISTNVPTSGSGDIKLFKTIQEMEADTSATIGDLAMVYDYNKSELTETSAGSVIEFPDRISLGTAITSASFQLVPVDTSITDVSFYCSASRTSITMECRTATTSEYVSYRGTLGKIFTKRQGASSFDFGTDVKFSGTWKADYSLFLTMIGHCTFDGLYKYNGTEWEIAPNNLTATDVSDLYPGKSAYTNTGYKIGDGSIWNKMTAEQFRAMLYGTNPSDDSTLLQSLTHVAGITGLTNEKTIYGLDYDLSEDTTEDYVLMRSIFPLDVESKTLTTSSSYGISTYFVVSKQEIYVFTDGNSGLAVYKYHLDNTNSLVFDETISSDIVVSGDCPLFRYADGIIYCVATNTNNAPVLIEYDTTTKTFTLVKTCSTTALANSIVDFNVNTGLCYFVTDTNIYKWNTKSSTSAVSIKADTFNNSSYKVEGVVEYDTDEFFAVISNSKIHIVNRANSSVTSITDNSGKFTSGLARGRCITYNGYLYVISRPNTTSIYSAKINLSTKTLVTSEMSTVSYAYIQRCRMPLATLVLDDEPDKIYIMGCNGFSTSSGSNNVMMLFTLDVNTLAVNQLPVVPYWTYHNLGFITQLIGATNPIISGNNFELFSRNQDNLTKYKITQFVISNVTDYIHGDMPMLLHATRGYFYINPIYIHDMANKFNKNIVNQENLMLANDILGNGGNE